MLDELEALNLEFFESIPYEEARILATQSSALTMNRLRSEGIQTYSYREAFAVFECQVSLFALRGEYAQRGPFFRHCINDTYSNLKPRLSRLGVERTDKRLVGLSRYLVAELALKATLAARVDTWAELVPRGEAEIFRRLLDGTYCELLGRAQVHRVVVPVEGRYEVTEVVSDAASNS